MFIETVIRERLLQHSSHDISFKIARGNSVLSFKFEQDFDLEISFNSDIYAETSTLTLLEKRSLFNVVFLIRFRCPTKPEPGPEKRKIILFKPEPEKRSFFRYVMPQI